METAGSNNYQLVVRQDDLAKRTATSFQMNATQEVSAHDLDNYHVYEALKQRENEYMAQNQTIMLKNGHFDEAESSYVQFKR